jgi:cytochrome b561
VRQAQQREEKRSYAKASWAERFMVIRDKEDGYGVVARFLHWGMAVAIPAMFGLGLWMVGLDYYSPYYKSAPDLHRSAGILLLIALCLRVMWRAANVKPGDGDLTPFERKASRLVHRAFYPLLFALMISGYVMSTADGRSIEVFGWFSVPSLYRDKGLESAAGLVHEWTAYGVIALAVLHAAAALRHRFAGTEPQRSRMWSGPTSIPIADDERTLTG